MAGNDTLPDRIGPPSKPSVPSNQTLYLTNLPDKLRKPDVRHSLYTLFATYGPVIDVVAMPKSKMRGQAWIAFRDVQAATQAMRSLQGFDFFGKQMKIQYARGKSNAIAKLDGTYRIPSAVNTAAQSTKNAERQQIFDAPPSNLPKPPVMPQGALATNGRMDLDDQAAEAKSMKRGREEESDEEVAMDEDSDAPMEEASDDED